MQTTALDNKRRNQLIRLHKEKEQANTKIQKMKSKEGEINNFLLQLPSATFVKQCGEFLRKHDFTQKESESPLPSWRKPVFIPPALAPEVYSDEFMEFSENNILGHFADEDVEVPTVEVIPTDNFRNEVSNVSQAGPGTISTLSAESMTVTSAPTPSQENSGQKDESQECTNKDPLISVFRENIVEDVSQNYKPVFNLKAYIDRKKFDRGHLKIFSDAVFTDYSMWVCGWTRNRFKKNVTVLLNAAEPDYTVEVKKTKRDEKAEQATLMVPYREYILFAKKGGDQIFSFHLNSHKFRHIHDELSVAALCCSNNFVYILSQKTPDFIKILDFQFQPWGNVPSFTKEEKKNYDFDICFISAEQQDLYNQNDLSGHAVVLCKSGPTGFVRKVDRKNGQVWQVDNSSHPWLTPKFEPCSVSASDAGDVFVADRGTDSVSKTCLPLIDIKLFHC